MLMYDDEDYEYEDHEYEYEGHENEEYGGGEHIGVNHEEDDETGSEGSENDAVANKNYAGFVPFVGEGFPATCSGRCLCRYYSPKSPYNTDCACCDHALSYHRPR